MALAGPLLDDVRALASTLSSNVSVRFLGYTPNDQVLGYYRHHPVDVFVNVSESEGVPVSIMEALSFGVPCVATDVGGVRELLYPEFGYLLPAHFEIPDLAAVLHERNWRNKSARLAAKAWQQRYFSLENYRSFCEFLITEARRRGF